MKKTCVLLAELIVLTFVFAQMASAVTVMYVTTNGTGQGTSWTDPTNNLQGAIDAIAVGAANTVWVSNGVYQTGGVINYPSDAAGAILTNRVAITKAITVRSLNGPAVTTIKGAWATAGTTNGWGAVRCVYMAIGSSLIGFTLTNGAVLTSSESAIIADWYGGGVYVGGPDYPGDAGAIISNCVITGIASVPLNGAVGGGTLYHCTLSGNVGPVQAFGILYNCLVTGNSAPASWVVKCDTMYNCTIVSNSGTYGMFCSTLYNCISWNPDTAGDNLVNPGNWERPPHYSCGLNELSGTGCYTNNGCITNNPLFVDSAGGNYRLAPNSPCVNTGTNGSWTTGALDLDGHRRIDHFSGRVDMGAYEFLPSGTMFSVR